MTSLAVERNIALLSDKKEIEKDRWIDVLLKMRERKRKNDSEKEILLEEEEKKKKEA